MSLPHITMPAIGASPKARALLWAQQFIAAHVGPGHYPVSCEASMTDSEYTRPHLWVGWCYTCSCGKTYDVWWVGPDGWGLDLFKTTHDQLEIALLEAAGQPVP